MKLPATKLVDYLEASSSAERTRTIRSCIDPPEYLFRYGDVTRAIGKSLQQGDSVPLVELREKYLALEPHTAEEARRISDAIDCAKHSEFLLKEPKIAGRTVARYSTQKRKFLVEGVEVVVSPQCLFLDHPKGSTKAIGALKAYTSKSRPLNPTAAAFLGTIVHWYLEDVFDFRADPTLCVVVDVFREHLFQAPNAFVRRRQTLTHACQEIADRWPTLQKRMKGRIA